MLTYGLTGGIGSGKSTVADILARLGIPSFDADELGRDLLSTKSRLCRKVADRYPECTTDDGGIDRSKLADKVFSSRAEREWLEDLLHPAIWKAFASKRSEMTRPRPPACLLEGAVILESHSREWQKARLAGLIVVSAPLSVRIARLRARDGLDEERIRSRLESQMEQCDKILGATHLIDNGGDLESTREQTRSIGSQIFSECGGRS